MIIGNDDDLVNVVWGYCMTLPVYYDDDRQFREGDTVRSYDNDERGRRIELPASEQLIRFKTKADDELQRAHP
jgi:hypothetical protein